MSEICSRCGHKCCDHFSWGGKCLVDGCNCKEYREVITAKVPIDPEFLKVIESGDLEAFKAYIINEIKEAIIADMIQHYEEEEQKALDFLYGKGDPEVTGYIPGIGPVNYTMKPINQFLGLYYMKPKMSHYERMMMHRRQKKYGRKGT